MNEIEKISEHTRTIEEAVARLRQLADKNERASNDVDEAIVLGMHVIASTIHGVGTTIEQLVKMLPMAAMAGLAGGTPPIVVPVPGEEPTQDDLGANPLTGGALTQEEIDSYLNRGGK
jgi:hypothetical protein